ncbi:hypothetical protein ACFLX4_00415 [Chloroflexota bacterium]
MSFVITAYVPEAIIMASDSRQTITIKRQSPPENKVQTTETVNSDFVYKTFLLSMQGVGISTFGEFMLGNITVESHIKRFQEEKLKAADDILSVSQKILEFFKNKFPSANVAFHVAGFKKESGISVPHVYACQVSRNEMRRLNERKDTAEVTYGVSWGGEGDIIAGILSPTQRTGPDGKIQQVVKAPVIWQALPVQDAIDFAIYAVRTTIDTIRFQARPKSVGGPIDVLLLTPEESSWIQRKEYSGEIY